MSFQQEKKHRHKWATVQENENFKTQKCQCGQKRSVWKCELCKGEYFREGHHKCKKGVNDIVDYLELEQIIHMITDAQPIPYTLCAVQNRRRDYALLSFLALTGMRVSEALSIWKRQVNLEDSGWVEIRNVKILKRRKEPILKDFGIPREGVLKPLTDLFLAHYSTLKGNNMRVFNINRTTAWRITMFMTGKWCHFFRSQRISFLVNRFRSTVIASDMQGIKSPSTIAHYYKGGWSHFKEDLKG